MKAFGVRLAAGAMTILLGAIMAAQAQKDHQDDVNSSWSPKLSQAEPAPIMSQLHGEDGDPDTESADESDKPEPSPFADVPDAVQLVQHIEPASDPGGASSTFAIPDAVSDALAEQVQVKAPPKMNLPPLNGASVAPSEANGSGPSFNLPPSLGASSAIDDPAANNTDGTAMSMIGENAHSLPDTNPALSTLPGAGGQPVNALRGGDAALRGGTDRLHAEAMHAPSAESVAPQNPVMSAATPNSLMNKTPEPMLRPVELPDQSRANQFAGNNQFRGDNSLPPSGHIANQSQFVQGNQFDQNPMSARRSQAFDQTPPLPAPNNQNLGQQDFSDNSMMRNNAFRDRLPNDAVPVAPPLHRTNQFAGGNEFTGQPQPEVTRSGFPGRMASAPLGNNALRSTGYTAGQNQGRGVGGVGQPGERRLEGAQTPSVVIHKRAPAEVKVGKPASFVIQVQNVGSAEALNVRVLDQVPAGMSLRDATPQPKTGANGEYIWALGNLSAGEEKTITMEMIPQAEGELGSVARVTFEAAASVRTVSTRPELKIVQKAPPTVPIGQQLEIEVEVSNPGTGDATGVMLQEDVPDGLEHPVGRQLDNLVGTLRPGEVRRQLLRMRAVAPGMVKNVIRLKADDGLTANHAIDVQVVAPDLRIALSGPSRRYLERPADFSLEIMNAGTYRAGNVRITAFLDRGFKFMETGNQGMYDQNRHAVFWELANLPPGEKGSIPLKLLPIQEGARAIQLEAKADLGAIAKNEHQVSVESHAELSFTINDSADPIEVGTETTYEVKVSNNGSRPDSNVQLQLQFPAGVEVLQADDAQAIGNGVISFSPRNQLAANGEIIYRIKARGRQQGTHLIKAVVTSDQRRVPVTKEESTMVYDDRGTIAAQPAGFRR